MPEPLKPTYDPFPAGAGMHRAIRAYLHFGEHRSPQARGCTAEADLDGAHEGPFPAGAGMHRW